MEKVKDYKGYTIVRDLYDSTIYVDGYWDNLFTSTKEAMAFIEGLLSR